MNMKMGMDIGYSNLKLAMSDDAAATRCIVLPAGAAPAERFGTRFDGGVNSDYLHVVVNGEKYIAGVSPDKAALWSRSLHADYASSDSYKALFHASLLLSESDVIDVLVTGLPVSQFYDAARKQSVEDMMTGVHQVTNARVVEVKKTVVIPQPVGGFLDYVHSSGFDVSKRRVLVIDPGFFSVDWVVINNGDLQKQSSGTSLSASSVILEHCSRAMAEEHGARVSVELLEGAMRDGSDSVRLLGKDVLIADYVASAVNDVAPSVLESIKRCLRTESGDIDDVLIVGGGAEFFAESIREVFDWVNVIVAEDSVCSNARGFLVMASSI